MKFFFSLSLFLTAMCSSFSQSTDLFAIPENKSSVYLTWGYHWNSYTRSTIHLRDHKSDDYDFTLYKAKAHDQPDMRDFFQTALTVPQYVLRIGYMLGDKRDLGIEFSWDHLKYVVGDYQTMHLKGTIRGTYYDKDTLVTPSLVHFEHTNGNNYAMLSVVKRMTFFESKYQRLSAIFSGGAGVLVPKTDSKVLGNHNDGPFRYSGIVFGMSAGFRYQFFKYLYFEPSLKGAFADYTNAKVYLQGRARHTFFSAQYIVAAGINVPIGK